MHGFSFESMKQAPMNEAQEAAERGYPELCVSIMMMINLNLSMYILGPPVEVAIYGWTAGALLFHTH